MRFPIPAFVPVPSPETMHIISIVSLIAGICLVGGTAFFLFLHRGNGRKQRRRLCWFFMSAGVLLILNHSILLFC